MRDRPRRADRAPGRGPAGECPHRGRDPPAHSVRRQGSVGLRFRVLV